MLSDLKFFVRVRIQHRFLSINKYTVFSIKKKIGYIAPLKVFVHPYLYDCKMKFIIYSWPCVRVGSVTESRIEHYRIFNSSTRSVPVTSCRRTFSVPLECKFTKSGMVWLHKTFFLFIKRRTHCCKKKQFCLVTGFLDTQPACCPQLRWPLPPRPSPLRPTHTQISWSQTKITRPESSISWLGRSSRLPGWIPTIWCPGFRSLREWKM